MNIKITIIGGGNLGSAIALGIQKSGFITTKKIHVADHIESSANNLTKAGIKVTYNNKEAIKDADIVLLAIKPYQIKKVLSEIKNSLSPKQILASCVTGFSISNIQEFVGKEIAIFRIMPNTAIAIQESITCIAKENSNSRQDKIIKDLFDQLGKAVFIEEEQMAAATVLGASGIAFALRFISAATKAGIEAGFDLQTSQQIAAQMTKGATQMALNGKDLEAEINRVTTPNGCTIAGLDRMEENGFSNAIIKGIARGVERVHEMAKENE